MFECSIYPKNKDIIKTECDHNFCTSCFTDIIQQEKENSMGNVCSIARPTNLNNYNYIDNLKCGVCRSNIKNSKLELLINKNKSIEFFKNLNKNIGSCLNIVLLSNNSKFLNFFTKVIVLFNPKISISCISDNNFIFKESDVVIVDQIFNIKQIVWSTLLRK